MSENKLSPTNSGNDVTSKLKVILDVPATAPPKAPETSRAFAPKSTTAVALGDRVNATVSLAPLVQAFVEGDSFYEYPVEVNQSLIVLCSERPTADWLRGRFHDAIHAKSLEVASPLTSGPTNFFQVEGRALLTTGIKPPRDVLILILPAVGRKSSLPFSEMVSLLDAAHARCHTVIVVFQGLSSDDTARLSDYFDVVLHVEACEPDHGYLTAFTVAPAPGTLLAAIGKRPVIDNIRLDSEGQIERHHYECVSPNAMTREIAKLIQQGKSYTEIAGVYEVNKTTIMRRVDALPFVPKGRLGRTT